MFSREVWHTPADEPKDSHTNGHQSNLSTPIPPRQEPIDPVKDSDDNIMGESIGVEGKDIVLKEGNSFMIVPLASLVLEDDILRIKKKINWKSAKKKGEKWKKKELDPL